jgi:UDP-N-acetylglucosamine 2-epimerase (non-hydrolysing)
MIMIVIGTRPEFVKMASVVDACQRLAVDHEIVFAAQHYDWEMSEQFLKELDLPRPDHRLKVGSGTQAVQTGKAMIGLEKVIREDRPSAVAVQGDTNTVLAGALAAVKLHVPVCHVEAGLRSHDLRMPEEHNRRLVDHVSSLLFAPTNEAAENLRGERVWGDISVTGNTSIDACLKFMRKAVKRSCVLSKVRFEEFAVATFHRAENVDHAATLRTFVKVLMRCPIPVVFPVHPRTMDRLSGDRLLAKLKVCRSVQLLPPVGYLDFLMLMKKCRLILTDSGGIQEEATAPNIRKPVLVLRRTTDRPESVQAGFSRLVGIENGELILREIRSLLEDKIALRSKSPFGDGRAGDRIAKVLKKTFPIRR